MDRLLNHLETWYGGYIIVFAAFVIGMVFTLTVHECTSPQQRQQQAWENYLEARDE